MASFDLFLPLLLKLEGGYVDDPDDPGGETNRGITMGTFRACSRELLGIEPISANLKALSDRQAAIIYKARYWDRMKGDAFELQDLADIVCDFYVNAGPPAAPLLQRVMNGMGAKVTEDGVIGAASLAALKGLAQGEVYRRYKQGRITFYRKLVEEKPTLAKFLGKWLSRVDAFPDLPASENPRSA
jgi:lysozyme family protein